MAPPGKRFQRPIFEKVLKREAKAPKCPNSTCGETKNVEAVFMPTYIHEIYPTTISLNKAVDAIDWIKSSEAEDLRTNKAFLAGEKKATKVQTELWRTALNWAPVILLAIIVVSFLQDRSICNKLILDNADGIAKNVAEKIPL